MYIGYFVFGYFLVVVIGDVVVEGYFVVDVKCFGVFGEDVD